MLTSLFGDLGPSGTLERRLRKRDAPDRGFEATSLLETVDAEVNARGQIVDRHSHELIVTGSPSQAIRDHFGSTRSDLDTAAALITLLDPAGVWAAAVIKALSDAGGRPIERLHLRERTTLRTLATIERTTLVRRHHDTLRIYHADVRMPGRDNAEIPIALMERSQMTTVIIGPMQPHAVDEMLQALHAASMLPSWRCPNLLFMLPPQAPWIAHKVAAIAWPGRLHVHVLSEPMSSASSVWNAMLGMWNQVKTQPGWAPGPGEPHLSSTLGEFTARPMAPAAAVPFGSPSFGSAFGSPSSRSVPPPPDAMPVVRAAEPAGSGRHVLDATRAESALAALIALDGVLGCAVVDAGSGQVLARETRSDVAVDIELAAAASAQALRAHRQAAHSMGIVGPLDEVTTTAGTRQQLLRTVAAHPELFLLSLLDTDRADLTLARARMIDAGRGLAD